MSTGTKALTASDRCDRCGGQAYAETMHEGFTLLWCAHHLREHKVALVPDLIHDETHRLAPPLPQRVPSKP